MEPIPDQEPVTREEWDASPLKAHFRSVMKDPSMRIAIAIWKEEFRCVHGTQNPTLMAGLDPIQSAAALNFFREGANAAINCLIAMGYEKPERKKPITNDPKFPGDYIMKGPPAENQPPKHPPQPK